MVKGSDKNMMGYYGWNTFQPTFGLSWLVGVFFWVFLIILVVGLIRWYSSGGKNEDRFGVEAKDGKPLDILKERYVKGEITKKEFIEMKKDISEV